MKMSSFFYAYFTYFLRFLRPFFSFVLSNESVKLFLRIFYVLFTLFTPFLIFFSFPMKVSSFFYAFFTYFLRFVLFLFFFSNENVKLFLRIFLRTFYAFYALSYLFYPPWNFLYRIENVGARKMVHFNPLT